MQRTGRGAGPSSRTGDGDSGCSPESRSRFTARAPRPRRPAARSARLPRRPAAAAASTPRAIPEAATCAASPARPVRCAAAGRAASPASVGPWRAAERAWTPPTTRPTAVAAARPARRARSARWAPAAWFASGAPSIAAIDASIRPMIRSIAATARPPARPARPAPAGRARAAAPKGWPSAPTAAPTRRAIPSLRRLRQALFALADVLERRVHRWLQSGLTPCSGSCADTSTNLANCGGCSQACGADELCSGGTCICQGSFVDCGGGCVESPGRRLPLRRLRGRVRGAGNLPGRRVRLRAGGSEVRQRLRRHGQELHELRRLREGVCSRPGVQRGHLRGGHEPLAHVRRRRAALGGERRGGSHAAPVAKLVRVAHHGRPAPRDRGGRAGLRHAGEQEPRRIPALGAEPQRRRKALEPPFRQHLQRRPPQRRVRESLRAAVQSGGEHEALGLRRRDGGGVLVRAASGSVRALLGAARGGRRRLRRRGHERRAPWFRRRGGRSAVRERRAGAVRCVEPGVFRRLVHTFVDGNLRAHDPASGGVQSDGVRPRGAGAGGRRRRHPCSAMRSRTWSHHPSSMQ